MASGFRLTRIASVEVILFVVGAIALVVFVAWLASRDNERERKTYDALEPEQKAPAPALHSRQDLKLIAYLLCAVVVMLGTIADRL